MRIEDRGTPLFVCPCLFYNEFMMFSKLWYKSRITSAQAMETGLALPEGGDFSSRWSSISAGENS